MDADARLLGRVWDLLKARDARPRPQPQVDGRPGVSIVDYDDAPADLMIYDEIGFWGVTAQDIAEQMQGRRGDLHVRINSPGGDVFDGYAIFNMLAAHDGQITVTVEGLAASAASFIAMAGDRVRVCLASQMMIHDASGICMGNAADMRDWADVLDSVSNTVAGIYADRGSAENGNGNADDWRDLMRAETWYTPQEAVDAGLADEIVTPKRRGDDSGQGDQAAAARWDLTVFQYAGRLAAPTPVIRARHNAPDIEATAVGPHDTEAKDGTWDKGANESRLPSPVPLATAKKFYAAYDETQVEDGAIPKAAGKLPHHFVDTDGNPGAASLNGVRNALARLPQTEGLSEAEKATVERHLRNHLPADDSNDHVDAPVHGDAHDRTTQPQPADAGDGWAALIGGLLTAPARVSAPSTVDELLGDLRQKGWTA